MRRTLLPIAAAALLGGCGSAGEDLLTERQAERLLSAVDDVDRAAGAQECASARRAAQQGSQEAAELPRRVDRELKRSLSDGFEHLADRVRQECGAREEEPEETATATPAPTETAEPTPTETAEPTPTATAEPTVTAEPTPEDGTGGVEPPPDDGVDGGG